MNNSPSADDRPTLQDEMNEELALRSALKRTRLEEAARNPGGRWTHWTIYAAVAITLIFFQEKIADHLWWILPFIFFEIHSRTSTIHARIDAIFELEKLDRHDPAAHRFSGGS